MASAAPELQPWVLLVEDNPEMQDLLMILLEHDGFAVARALNGRDALALLRTVLRPCVIVLDYHLPAMDAQTFRREQLATGLQLDVPVILYSGDASVPVEDLAVQAVLRKPFEYEDLRAAIERVCAPSVARAAFLH